VTEPSHTPTPPVAQRMQELLSRAVEEQVGEQRHLADALTELRRLVARLPGEVSEATATTAASAAAETSGALAGLREELARTSSQVEVTADRVQALSARLDGLDDLAGRLPEEGAVDPAQAAEAAQSAMAPVLARLGEVEERFSGRLAGLDMALPAERSALLGELGPRLDAVSASALTRAEVDAAVTPAVEAVAEVSHRLVAVSEELSGRMDDLSARLDARLEGLAEIESRLGERLDGAVAGLSAHIDEAVLALAAALLRSPGSSASPAPASVVAAVAETATATERGGEVQPGPGAVPREPGPQSEYSPADPGAPDGERPHGEPASARRRSWWKQVE
jgi:hypothetical protein